MGNITKGLDFAKKFFPVDVGAYRSGLYFDESWVLLSENTSPQDPGWLDRLQSLVRVERPPEPRTRDDAHLVLVTECLGPGGAERQWCYLARELSSRGYRVTLLTINPLEGDNAHYLPLLEGSGVRVIDRDSLAVSEEVFSYATNHVPIDACLLAIALDHLRPSHVLAQLDYSNVWCSAATFLQHFPPLRMLISFRSANPTRFSALYAHLYHECYRVLCASKRVVINANSYFGAKDYADWINIDVNRVNVVHNAVQIPKYLPQSRENIRRSLGISDSDPVVMGVFRLTQEKNPNLFLEVAQTVHEKSPETIFLHVGTGPGFEALREAAESRGMQGWFRLLGRRDDVDSLMRAADVLLLCSNFEGFPNVLLEAQAAELPVVSTRVGGAPEAMREGETGLLAEARDSDGLARCCIQLLRDPERRRRMGHAGRRFVEENFTTRTRGDAFLAQLGLSEWAPNPSIVKHTGPPEEIPLAARYWQTRLEDLLQECPELLQTPLLIFAPRSLSRRFAALLPPHSLCLTLPGVTQPEEMPSMELDWREPRTYSALKGRVWPGSCALIMDDWPLWENMEGRLRATGVRWLVVLWRSNWYRFPLSGRKIWHELHGLFRKARRKIKKRLGGRGAK